jgi:hypothetical protein
MSERHQATGYCDCGAIIYGPGIYCDGCTKARAEQRNEERER